MHANQPLLSFSARRTHSRDRDLSLTYLNGTSDVNQTVYKFLFFFHRHPIFNDFTAVEWHERHSVPSQSTRIVTPVVLSADIPLGPREVILPGNGAPRLGGPPSALLA